MVNLRKGRDRFIGSYEDLMASKRIGSTSDHDIYICPFCAIINDNGPDTKGKFYWNPSRKTGDCKRCETVVFYDGLSSIEEISARFSTRYENLSPELQEVSLNLRRWSSPISGEPLQYMLGRNITEETLRKFDVRSMEYPRKAVVFIDKFKEGEKTNFLQLRALSGKVRHSTLKNLKRPAVWLDRASEKAPLALVEGFSSGLALWQATKLHPVVLTGKRARENQICSIAEKSEGRTIYICLDGGFYKEALMLSDQIYKRSVRSEVRIVALERDKDPNDVTEWALRDAIEGSYLYKPALRTVVEIALKRRYQQ